MHRKLITIALLAALPLAGCGSSSSSSSPSSSGSTSRAKFVRTIDNPWFPLKPGSTWRYRGEKDGKTTTELMTATNRTKRIQAADATVVTDRLYSHGHVIEDTLDYYAQDSRGNVWYMGEATRELDAHGKTTSTEGSWQTGVNGAKPGIFMPPAPAVGQSFRQEYLKGQAEDHFAVAALGVPVKVPGARSSDAMRTREWTPLEPGVIDHKLYVRGIGTALEQTVKGGDERNTLVSVKRG
jgi:hypothetical protein